MEQFSRKEYKGILEGEGSIQGSQGKTKIIIRFKLFLVKMRGQKGNCNLGVADHPHRI